MTPLSRHQILRLALTLSRADRSDPRVGLIQSGQVVKRCGCGRRFSLVDVLAARTGGIQYDENDQPALYLFHCQCKSTLAVPVELICRRASTGAY